LTEYDWRRRRNGGGAGDYLQGLQEFNAINDHDPDCLVFQKGSTLQNDKYYFMENQEPENYRRNFLQA
jgi:hypothetical protein